MRNGRDSNQEQGVFKKIDLVKVAAVVNESDDGGDEPLVAVEPLDDGGDDGLVGRRVEARHFPGREPDKVPDVPEREDERLPTFLFGDLESML